MATSSCMVFPGARFVPGGVFLTWSHKPRVMGRVVAIGDQVEWDSTTGGLWSRKEGEVIEVVPAGCRPQKMRSTVVRDQESYVVRCPGGQVWWPITVRRR